MKSPAFAKKADEEKLVPILIRLKPDEATKLRQRAGAAYLTLAEYSRRQLMGKKTLPDTVTPVVLALSDLTRAVRELHAAMPADQQRDLEAQLNELLLRTRAALLRIGQ